MRVLIILLVCLAAIAMAKDSEKQAKYLKRTGEKWLAEKSLEEGVVTLPSGLRYKVLTQGSGKKHPKPTDQVEVHYAGTLKDGTQFDSSIARGSPATFGVNGVIKGWTEALQLMVVGDVWELYIPSDLAYGERGSPPKIPAHSPLQFEVRLLGIK